MNQLASDTLGVPLSHWGVIRARGADAHTFLHGQLTQDVMHLGPAQARLAGYCSAKGRLLASFVMWSPQADEVMLACHTSVLAATLKRLSMFVMRAKCQLADATAEVALRGVTGDAALAATYDLAVWGKRDDATASWIRLPDVDGVRRAWQVATAASDAPSLPASAELKTWQRLEIESGVAMIEAATADQFVPQMLNFELIGAVNFQKGCYPGQEVVARSQYRGTTKRRTFLFASEVALAAGQEVFHSADPAQPAGLVACAADASTPGSTAVSYRALIEVKLAALDGGSLHLGAADGALLTQHPLPYEVVDAADASLGPA
jgi:tRNA-modifying protein YgfZ